MSLKNGSTRLVSLTGLAVAFSSLIWVGPRLVGTRHRFVL